jgi:nucleotide-binding universal stress UspA family protein
MPVAGPPSFKTILFPVDFSERARAVAPFVLSMAQRYQAKVVLLHALMPPPPIYSATNAVYPEIYDFTGLSASLRAELEKFAEAELPKIEVTCGVELGDAASVITDFAEQENIGLIAMPTHGHGAFRRVLLGSVTAKVLHDSKTPVWTAAHAAEPSHRAHPQPRHIVCAIDLKAESRHALESAIEIAADANATIELLHVAAEGEIDALVPESRMQDLLVEAARAGRVQIQEGDGSARIAKTDASVADMVRDVAIRKKADLVVIGRGSIVGTVGRWHANAYEIVREAPCPVLSV